MHPATPTLTLALLFLVLYQLSAYYSYRDPGSVFFDPSRAYTRRYSDIRTDEVKHTVISKTLTPSITPSTCAIFTTWKRPIDVTLQSFSAGLYPQERSDIHLAVLFAHVDPAAHPSWGLATQVDKAISYGNDSHLAEMELTGDYLKKGIADYTLALEYCRKRGSAWTAVFEDDILFAESWYARLKQALVQPVDKELLYLRIFNDERATGWANRGFFANNELYIALFVDAVVLGALWRKPLAMKLPILLFIPGIITLFYASGKATMLPPGPGIRQENFGCCSQALVYPKHQLQPLIDYLRGEGSGQVDILVNRFGRERGFHRKTIYPIMVQHRGLSSVRGTTAKDTQSVWSMAFENLEADTLKTEHRSLAGKIWPEVLSD